MNEFQDKWNSPDDGQYYYKFNAFFMFPLYSYFVYVFFCLLPCYNKTDCEFIIQSPPTEIVDSCY